MRRWRSARALNATKWASRAHLEFRSCGGREFRIQARQTTGPLLHEQALARAG